jgi:hypothetical protein
MKHLLAATLLCAALPLAQAAAPTAQELTDVYNAQTKALAAGDRAALAATVDEESCRDIQQAFLPFADKKDAQAALLQALLGVSGPELRQMAPCDAAAQLALGVYKTTHRDAASLLPERVTLLGIVPDGQDRVYGVFRTTTKVEGIPLTVEELVGFTRNGEKWKVGANSSIKAIVTGMKALGNR